MVLVVLSKMLIGIGVDSAILNLIVIGVELICKLSQINFVGN